MLAQKPTLDFPYQQQPHVDFFQYPPLKPATDEEQLARVAQLALDQPLPRERRFAIFVSIPYCRSKCHSCHFFKGLLPPQDDRHALLNDYMGCLDIQVKKYAQTTRFSTGRCGALYLGGGTASLLAADQVDRLIRTIAASFTLEPTAEITLEGNPLDFSFEYLQRVKASGVTRLSIGLQSFQDATLKAVGSLHDGHASLTALSNALAVNFDTINVDFLYKLPGQTLLDWQHDLQTALAFEPNSITAYAYVIHSGSAAERLIAEGRIAQPIDQEAELEWYLWTQKFLEQRGYAEAMKGYFSKPGHEKRYGTLNYKAGDEYIGLGAGAYSFVNGYQFSAHHEADLYKAHVRQGLFPVADYMSVQATPQNLMERYSIFNFFFSMLNRQAFAHRFGTDPLAVWPQLFEKLQKYELVTIRPEEIRLTELGKKWRENVLYEFYADEFKTV